MQVMQSTMFRCPSGHALNTSYGLTLHCIRNRRSGTVVKWKLQYTSKSRAKRAPYQNAHHTYQLDLWVIYPYFFTFYFILGMRQYKINAKKEKEYEDDPGSRVKSLWVSSSHTGLPVKEPLKALSFLPLKAAPDYSNSWDSWMPMQNVESPRLPWWIKHSTV